MCESEDLHSNGMSLSITQIVQVNLILYKIALIWKNDRKARKFTYLGGDPETKKSEFSFSQK